MRVTEKTKKATRKDILAAAGKLFRSKGFEQATTRDIAAAAGIASGTLFNYFASKEAIVLTLLSGALEKAAAEFEKKRRDGTSLEEDLFSHIAFEIRSLKPLRKFLRPVIPLSFSPVVMASRDGTAVSIRVGHLERVSRLLAEHGITEPTSPLTMHLYWTLYTGVLTFWCEDRSSKQEDSLALLDQSLDMFVNWLETQEQARPESKT